MAGVFLPCRRRDPVAKLPWRRRQLSRAKEAVAVHVLLAEAFRKPGAMLLPGDRLALAAGLVPTAGGNPHTLENGQRLIDVFEPFFATRGIAPERGIMV